MCIIYIYTHTIFIHIDVYVYVHMYMYVERGIEIVSAWNARRTSSELPTPRGDTSPVSEPELAEGHQSHGPAS